MSHPIAHASAPGTIICPAKYDDHAASFRLSGAPPRRATTSSTTCVPAR
ncbi:MAG: hypothetical protein U0325_34745 [Polyangiales bacterium]